MSLETTHGETVEPGKWISWKRDKALEKRRFGKVIEDSGTLFITCQPDSSAKGVVPDAWDMDEFSWAVAEGRVLADSIWVINDKLADHELEYI